MGKLTAKQRAAMPKSEFGVPSKAPGPGSFPMGDKGHAEVAKGRATQAEKAGRMSPGEKAKIDARADKVLGKPKGGKK